MSSRRRANKKFWNKVFRLFLLYLVLVPLIFLILDRSTVYQEVREDILVFILKVAGIALGIALIISFWSNRDPELRKY
ncbi:MAG TPA: hypothetical protein PKG90_04395 [Chitinophagaceae bacterium]|nr:hypothetical protein [Chitinophagaceae bacterium]HNU13644.1 hypothetical protein [Chitinophagaceae bacterium]